ncbi:hypothetical protein HKD37_04G011227 [Glycine soja]
MHKKVGGMKLCHFYNFKLAMLGKQGQNLLTDHDVILDHIPSLICRNTHASRVVVNEEGSRWHLGVANKIILLVSDLIDKAEDTTLLTLKWIDLMKSQNVIIELGCK